MFRAIRNRFNVGKVHNVRNVCQCPRLAAALLPLAVGLATAASPDWAAAGDAAPAPRIGNPPAAPSWASVNAPVNFSFAAFAAPAPAPAALDYESLGAALRQSGYAAEPKVLEGKSVYLVTADRPKCTIRIWAFLNSKQNLVCFDAIVGNPIDFDAPGAPAHLRRLLEKNLEIAPAFFAVTPESSRVRLMRQLPADGAAPAAVAEALRRFADTVEETSALWGQNPRAETPAPGWRGRPAAGGNRNRVGPPMTQGAE